jgi:hypothetical protein
MAGYLPFPTPARFSDNFSVGPNLSLGLRDLGYQAWGNIATAGSPYTTDAVPTKAVQAAAAVTSNYFLAGAGKDVDVWATAATAVIGSGSTPVLFVRLPTPATPPSYYGVDVGVSAASEWNLIKVIAGVRTVLAGPFTQVFAAGDGIGIRITGSLIRVFYRPGAGAWSQVLGASDTSLPNAGWPGILNNTSGTFAWDDFNVSYPSIVGVSAGIHPVNVLGCGIARASIRTRGGQSMVLDLPNVTSVDWTRVRSDTSIGTVELDGVAISQDPECCAVMRTIRPWKHELFIYRDDDTAWAGPIVEIDLNGPKLTIRARDLSAWLDRRFVHFNKSWGGSQANQGTIDSAVAFQAIVQDAYDVDGTPIDGNVASFDLFTVDNNNRGSMDLVARTYSPAQFKPAGPEVRDLAKGPLDWTIIKRTGYVNAMARWVDVNPNPVVNPDFATNTTGWAGMTRDTGVAHTVGTSGRTAAPPNATGSMTGLIVNQKYLMTFWMRGTGSALDAAQVSNNDGVVKVGNDESSVFSYYVYGQALTGPLQNPGRQVWAQMGVYFTATATTMPITITATGNPIDSHGIYFTEFRVQQQQPSFYLFDHSLASPPHITLSGLDQVNRAIVANQQSGGDYAFYQEAPKPVWVLGSATPPGGVFSSDQTEFGLLEGISTQPLSDATSAGNQAANQAAALGGTPILLDTITLNQHAGVTMDQLIPGTMFSLRLDEPCFAVAAQLILQSVSVKTTPASGEQVSLSFEPTGF